ncbi:MAG: ATP-dependent RNA helicase HrpA [Pseudomonadales bacterium]|nr:ATP-dependent RNA helicase HrpA [Pseudomonadales bacterium]
MNRPYNELSEAIDACMIRDRFRMRKLLASKRSRAKLEEQVTRSANLVEKRHAALPKVIYPPQLPVSQRVDEIKRAIEQSQVVIIAGETGSGKTTQIPKICLELGRGVVGKIGHTQPRRVAARTVATRIAEELSVKFGEEVGYQVRFTDKTTDTTLVKVMTDGILLAETQKDRFLQQYDTLIIDEAHERSLNIDFLLGYLKRILPQRPDLKVIITSATIDVERFSKHFSNAPVVQVSGRTFPVEVLYRPAEESSKISDADELVNQAILDALAEIEQLERGHSSPGDVLIFLVGEREIRELAQLIRKSNLKQLEVLPLYSRLSVAEQNRVFQRHKGRRVVLATNVAETSLTVPGIRYVIDPGLARISRYSFRSKVQQLPIERISQASANQRMGRCGRISDGVCIRLYSEEDFISRSEFTAPEILRTNLAAVILQMLVLKLGDVAKFPFIEKPDQRQINDGYHLLSELQAVDKRKQITRLGRDVSRIPIDLRLGRMLLEASKKNCLSDVLTIVSVLAIQDPRERPHERQQAADQKHRQYWDEKSDFVAFLKLWDHCEKSRVELTNKQFRSFCRENFISYVRYFEWRENHRQLRLMCQELKLNMNKQQAHYDDIHAALLSGLLGNLGEKGKENEYLGARNRRFYVFPGSSQFKRKPRWVMAGELVETTRLFGRTVAEIEPEWVEPLAQHLVKRTYHEPHFDADRGQVFAFEEVMLYGLVIIKRRRVDYGSVDPHKARQILIQSGLVEEQLSSKAGFYRHNCQLVAEVEQLESKSRKRDILVDTHTLYRFYDEKIPLDIVSGFDLDAWRKQIEVKQPKFLFMQKDLLMRSDAELSEAMYPNTIEIAEAKLKLDYQFDPQHEHDGVSVNIPMAILRQVDRSRLDWVIPGLLEEKCLAMIKSLPKALRKNFVPAPDYAKALAGQIEYDGRSLAEVMSEKLFRQSGVKVQPSDFQEDGIDHHLRMNIKVLNDQGDIVDTGRDLAALVEKYNQRVEQQFKQRDQHTLERVGVTQWDFEALPEEILLKQSGIDVRGYPALVDKGDSVAIEIIDNKVSAIELYEVGLQRLLTLQLSDQEKYVRRNIPGFKRFALFYATTGSSDELLNDLVAAIFRYTFIESQSLVRDRDGFQTRLKQKQELVNVMNSVGKLVGEILERGLSIQRHLKEMAKSHNQALVGDISAQLDQLIGERFLKRVPFQWLKQMPRYLKAIEYRMEKQSPKDDEMIGLVRLHWQRLIDSGAYNDRRTQQYRWMIEEYRVSLFAQPLGTSMPVSAKRLDKEWQGSANAKR